MQPKSDIFGNLCNPCIYNRAIFRILAYLEPKASSKACRICKMIMHIKEPWHSENYLFKHFQGYLGIFRNIDAYSVTLTGAQLGERGEASPALFEIEKSVLIFEIKALVVSIFGLNFPWNFFFLCFWQNFYRSALVPQNPHPPGSEKCLVAHLHSSILLFAKHIKTLVILMILFAKHFCTVLLYCYNWFLLSDILHLCSFHMQMFLSNQLIVLFYYHLTLMKYY